MIKRERFETLQSKYVSLKAEAAKLQKNLDYYWKKAEQLQQNKDELEVELTLMKTEVGQIRQQLANQVAINLSRPVSTNQQLSGEVEQAKADLNKIREELNREKRQVWAHETTINKNQQTIDELSRKVLSLQEASQKKDNQIFLLKNEYPARTQLLEDSLRGDAQVSMMKALLNQQKLTQEKEQEKAKLSQHASSLEAEKILLEERVAALTTKESEFLKLIEEFQMRCGGIARNPEHSPVQTFANIAHFMAIQVQHFQEFFQYMSMPVCDQNPNPSPAKEVQIPTAAPSTMEPAGQRRSCMESIPEESTAEGNGPNPEQVRALSPWEETLGDVKIEPTDYIDVCD